MYFNCSKQFSQVKYKKASIHIHLFEAGCLQFTEYFNLQEMQTYSDPILNNIKKINWEELLIALHKRNRGFQQEYQLIVLK